MKIRAGFVSNSSSSSFLLVGVAFQPELFSYKYDSIDDVYEGICRLGERGFMWLHQGLDDYPETNFIGLDMCSIKEDETYNQFKSRVFSVLKRLGYTGSESDISMYRDQGRI